MPDSAPICPGATLGVLGGGQLGRMFAHVATRMGYRVHVFSMEHNSPAGQVANAETTDDWNDPGAVRDFARACDAITFESENVPLLAVETAMQSTRVCPGPAVLQIAQDRVRERAFLQKHGFPCALHAAVHSPAEIQAARKTIGHDVVVKSARLGYDGRGQVRLGERDDVEAAWNKLNVSSAICEAWITYQCELSVLVARSAAGHVEAFGPIRNDHVNHILDCSTIPADVPQHVANDALELACAVAEAIELVGVLCVEMFLTTNGSLLINELAPRPHNSGHVTIEACSISQFEQQVRALCGLPVLPMHAHSAAAMVNLLGDLWCDGTPDWSSVLHEPGLALHLYGKEQPRPGRKMGHLTVLAPTPTEAAHRALRARQTLLPDKRTMSDRLTKSPPETDPQSSIHPLGLTVAI